MFALGHRPLVDPSLASRREPAHAQPRLDGAVLGAECSAQLLAHEVPPPRPVRRPRPHVAAPQAGRPPAVDRAAHDATKNNPLYSDSGSGIGYVFSLGIRGTGDIALLRAASRYTSRHVPQAGLARRPQGRAVRALRRRPEARLTRRSCRAPRGSGSPTSSRAAQIRRRSSTSIPAVSRLVSARRGACSSRSSRSRR